MALNATETVVAGTGNVYIAPVGTTMPTEVDTALDAAFIESGYTTEDGVLFRYSEDQAELKVWQTPHPVRTTITDAANEVEFELVQFNKTTLPLALGGGTVVATSAGKFGLSLPAAPTVQERCLVVDIVDGTVTWRIALDRVVVMSAGDVTFTDSDLSGLPLKFATLPIVGNAYVGNIFSDAVAMTP